MFETSKIPQTTILVILDVLGVFGHLTCLGVFWS